MSKVKIVLKCEKCGKEFKHEHTVAKASFCESYEAWARTHVTVCPDCYKAECEVARAEAKKKEEEETEAMIAEASIAMPDLSGTEKQVAWANDIRKTFAVIILKRLKRIHNAEKYDALRASLDIVIDKKTEAKYWIDNRKFVNSNEALLLIEETLKEQNI